MPIYEFYCPRCHMIFNFFSKSVNTSKKPSCPRCGRRNLTRHPSVFASPKPQVNGEDPPANGMDEARMERALNLLAGEADRIDDNDPRQAANLMRKLSDMTGLTFGPGMEEALKRMESGEDPETIEAEMGDLLEDEEPFSLKGKKIHERLRHVPPRVDEKLYDL